MILVTGASGKTGRAVIAALAARGQQVRAWVHRAETADALIRLGAAEVVTGSMADEAAFSRAAQGMRAIYHICPNVSSDEIVFGRNAIAAARATGIRRFVFHSVLHPQIEAMPHHWSKMRVEELLFETDLDVTILQPTAYMQNLLAGWAAITNDGVHRTPYPVATRISLIDLADVADVAARVLTETGHAGATYELVGTSPLSQTDVADVLSDALSRPVRAEAEPVEVWEARASAMGAVERDTLIKMFRYYERHGLAGNDNVLRWLLGRPPTTLAAFARSAADQA
jgi:uncharacterized protein YbjT (DUF2867 family)